ncbi:hypothetical protein DFP78_10367 [Photobacterium lutimaris]|nr:hypothetical protein DFP78_10367 [Photobacterium lutimaris]
MPLITINGIYLFLFRKAYMHRHIYFIIIMLNDSKTKSSSRKTRAFVDWVYVGLGKLHFKLLKLIT